MMIVAALLYSAGLTMAEDDVPFPLGSLGGKAFQAEGSSLLKVTEVTAGGPAAASGLLVGDQIYAVNGTNLSVTGSRYDDGWRGAVSELGYAIERSESTTGAISLGVLRPGAGALALNASLPANTAWRPSYPVGDTRSTAYYQKICADLHTKIQASSSGNFGFNTGWFGMTLLASPDWNSTSGANAYRNSINKLRDRCIAHLDGRVLEPVEPDQAGYIDPGLENWDIASSCMFIGEYRRKTGDTGVDSAVQRCALLLANRIQHYSQPDDGGTMHTKLGIMGHGGVTGDYAHLWLTGLNILNAHTTIAMGILKGAGADFSAISGSSGLTIDQKFLLNWSWLKKATNTGGGNDDGCVGYESVAGGWDAAGRTAGAAAGYLIYLAAGGTAATADDLDKLARQKAYVSRNWQRQQHAHAFTVGGTACSQMLMPFLGDREQRYFMENSRFLFTMSRDHNGSVAYFPGRANNGGDGYLDYNNVRYIQPGLVSAVPSGNLPSFPAPSTARVFVRMNSPLNDWPQLAARRSKVVGLVQSLNLDVTNNLGVTLASGYSAAWSQVTGAAVAFSSTATEDTTVTFPVAGNYRLRFTSTAGSYNVTEDYDFEVAASITPAVPNTITRQPVSRVGVPGGDATFTVATAGSGPFLYEWRLNGVAYWGSSSSPVLTLPNISSGHGGSYVCEISTPTGSMTSSAALLSIPSTSEVVGGGMRREVWSGISGNGVSDLTGNPNYPLFPDITSVVTTAEGPNGYADNYGQRLSGWVVPPVTGQYRFFLTSDDSSELWLGANDQAASKLRIAQVSGYTSYRAYSSGGKSVLISLVAGQSYYIEALQKEGGGGDHLSIAWQLPGEAAPVNGSAAIDGAYLRYTSVSADPLLDGLVSWWKLDDAADSIAADSLSTANDGTLTGATWAAGSHRGALSFDGNDRLTCSDRGSLSGLTPFTASAWVKVNAGVTQEMVVIQQRAADGFNGQYQLKISNTGKIVFYLYGDSTQQFSFAGTTSINDGKWHHIAGVRDDSGNARVYLDGVENGSVTGTTQRNLSSGISIGIGCDIRDSNKFFRGSIDDVRIHNRALAAAELAGIMNLAPVFATDPLVGTPASENTAYSAIISATDPEADLITYSRVIGPAWLSVAPDGTLSGTPGNGDVGVNVFTIRATDSLGASADVSLNIAVSNVNGAPAFPSDLMIMTATEDVAFTGQLTASDQDAQDGSTFVIVSGPAWLHVATDGGLSGTPANAHVGLNLFTVRVTDTMGAFDEATLEISVTNVNDVPVFTSDPIDLNAAEDTPLNTQLAASDIDPGDELIFTMVSGPAWLSVSAAGALIGTPSNSDVGANAFVVRVTDLAGAFDEAGLDILISNVNDAPVFTHNPIIVADASENAAYTGQTLAETAIDADAGDSIAYSKVSGPAWLNVAGNGDLTGTPPSASAGLNVFIIRVTDSTSSTNDAELRIQVVGLPLPWTSSDIGTGMFTGSASHADGVFTQAGSGTLGGSSDRLCFTYQMLTGDGGISARVNMLEDTGSTSRVGVMIRESLASNSRQIFIGLAGNGSYRWVRRGKTGGSNTTSNSGTGAVPDCWIRLARVGNTITAYKSASGSLWTKVGSTTVTLSANCYMGLAVSSGSNTTLNTSQFNNVSAIP